MSDPVATMTLNPRKVYASFTLAPTGGSSSISIQGGTNISVTQSGTMYTVAEKNFVYEQATVSDTWTITHNLGKYPSATVLDTAGSILIGDIEYTDLNTMVIHFNVEVKGKAYLN